ncbi:UpxY family transcription antiterminator [Desulfatibacillum aliphaticivorans]|uniref:NusG antitermination factor n=1 Tax=Desulfatibacillum aliphaticivorans TaxID=218208 RepID=B8FH43_DESAL|nr:UpxY family transcription antiterminator [Desulfatibacillum aliphaticivorans]ACL02131.1 NusG antitermination factor [Desulfatibacillum aliphaticivorans]
MNATPNLNTKQWYALYTKSRHEACVNNYLAARSIESFYPQMRILSRRKDRRKMIDVPMFPGYLFVRAALRSRQHLSILKAPGAVTLIGNTRGAIAIPEDTISSLRIVSQKEALETGPCYHAGDLVLIVSGPFAGVTGVFMRNKGGGKILVNIDALGQSVAVEMGGADVQLMQSYRKAG